MPSSYTPFGLNAVDVNEFTMLNDSMLTDSNSVDYTQDTYTEERG